MSIRYRIVDVEGDEMPLNLFVRDRELPVKVRSVKIHDGYHMTVTLEYLHGTGTDQTPSKEEEVSRSNLDT